MSQILPLNQEPTQFNEYLGDQMKLSETAHSFEMM